MQSPRFIFKKTLYYVNINKLKRVDSWNKTFVDNTSVVEYIAIFRLDVKFDSILLSLKKNTPVDRSILNRGDNRSDIL